MDNEITLEDVASDVQRAIQRCVKTERIDPRAEFTNNVYPLFLSLIEATNQRILEAEDMVSKIIDESETIIQPEEASQIDEMFVLAEDLITTLNKLTLADEVKAKIEMFSKSINKTREMLADFVIDDSETDESDEDAADEADDDEDEGEDE